MSVRLSIETARERLRRYSYRPITADEREIGASILIPLHEHSGEPHVVLTKRTMLMSRQQGHVSFPGGRREAGDRGLVETALRETFEEIGLAPGHVEILGRLDDFSTRDGEILVAAFVAVIDPGTCPYGWCPAEREVAEILDVPVRHFLNSENVVVEERRELSGRLWSNDTFLFRGHRVFGATARALRNLLDVAFSNAQATNSSSQ
jgi:8-oxo-dGTP pyrophosphatase MutT (NUDIX family)